MIGRALAVAIIVAAAGCTDDATTLVVRRLPGGGDAFTIDGMNFTNKKDGNLTVDRGGDRTVFIKGAFPMAQTIGGGTIEIDGHPVRWRGDAFEYAGKKHVLSKTGTYELDKAGNLVSGPK